MIIHVYLVGSFHRAFSHTMASGMIGYAMMVITMAIFVNMQLVYNVLQWLLIPQVEEPRQEKSRKKNTSTLMNGIQVNVVNCWVTALSLFSIPSPSQRVDSDAGHHHDMIPCWWYHILDCLYQCIFALPLGILIKVWIHLSFNQKQSC